MASRTPVLPPAWRVRHSGVALACCIASCWPAPGLAQAAEAPAAAQSDASAALPPVTVSAPAPARVPGIAGFGDRPVEALPLQATIIDREQLDAAGARRLADLTRFDPAIADAYNSPGYWDYLSVRGYVLDPRFNYRREGLPISAETRLSLVNKERVEFLKGTSGIQAGTSAPGGLVNYIVKRPTAQPLRRVSLGVGERGSVLAALDLGGRTGIDDRFGYRLNLAHDDRKPEIEDYGRLRSHLAAFAADWRLGSDSVIEAEIEWSRQTGASLPGFSLRGDTLPAPVRMRNLNNQPWSQPNVFDGLTGSLRYDQGLGGGWRWVTTLGTQRLKTDDRLAYPFGFDCNPTSSFTGDFWCDRYSPEGEFDVYDFRSENEKRRTHALQSAVQGSLQTGALRHDLRAGVTASRLRYRFGPQVNQYVGTGNDRGTAVTPANPVPNDTNTNRTERSTELFVNDAIDWGRGITTWVGLRYTRLHRDSIRTDGSRATAYTQDLTTPWLAASWAWAEGQFVYASWGQGAESSVVPGRPDRYGDRAGLPLPVLKSRQWELGLRGSREQIDWSLAWFDIDRPAITDAPPSYEIDGSNHHRGLEGSLGLEAGAWTLRGGAIWIDAQREGAADTSQNGLRPVNVPRHTLKLQTGYRVASVPGLALDAGVVHEGRRFVLPDNSIALPSWTRVDAGASLRHGFRGSQLTWRVGLDNVFDRRAWKESPLQFGHVYLFPLESRTLRLSVQADL